MENIIKFFEENKEQIMPVFDKIKVNKDKTLIKFGYIENERASITFYLHNKLDESISDFDNKLRCLFNADIQDFQLLENQLKNTKHCKITVSPFVEISKDPLIHAFQMTINFAA